MEAFRGKVEQATEEANHLKQLLSQKEQKITIIKNKQQEVKDVMNSITELKAVKQQMIAQNKQTYEELQTEFTGVNWFENILTFQKPTMN